MSWITETFTALQVLSARHLNQFRDNFLILESHRHTGEAGQGAVLNSNLVGRAHEFCVFGFLPITSTSYTGFNNQGGFTITAQNGFGTFGAGFYAGVYQISVAVTRGTARGILSITLDGSTVGSIDTYFTSTVNQLMSTTFTVSSAGWKELKFEATTKNSASGGYSILALTAPVFTQLS